MKTYCHTQRAGRWLIVPLAASMAMIAAAYLTGLWPVLSGVPVLALMSWLFASLTIEIDGTEESATMIISTRITEKQDMKLNSTKWIESPGLDAGLGMCRCDGIS